MSDHLSLIDELKKIGREEPEVTDRSNRRSNRRLMLLRSLLQDLSGTIMFRMVRKLWPLLTCAFRETITIVFLKLRFGRLVTQITHEPATVVMTTWLKNFNPSDDFFYGRLPHLLQEQGVNCLLLYNDWWDKVESESVRAVLTQSHIRSVPRRMILPFWAPLATAWNQILTSIALRRLYKKAKDSRFIMLCREACLACLNPDTMYQTLSYYAAREAVRIWRVRVFVTLYEGQHWEKPAWHGAKAANKDCVTVGYQHAVIMPHSLALTRPNHGSWELATPDVVLCLGETTKNMMKAGHEPYKTKLIPFGSFHRTISRSLRRTPNPEHRAVLVVPEGGESEYLFNFAMRAAPLLRSYHFIFRCHPNRPFTQLAPLEGVLERFPNIEISNYSSIVDDCARSSVVLYRASSSVFVALLLGLKPIYVHDDRRPDVDPVSELTSWRERASSPEDVEAILRRYDATTQDCAGEQWRSAAEYVHSYAMPVDEASIDRFLVAVGLKDGTALV